jgi:ABC-type dipeptide/oligopeptide/nickel transport system permease subunit
VSTTNVLAVRGPVPTVAVRAPRSATVNIALRVLRNPMGAAAVAILSILTLAALFAPLISPYDPIEQHRGAELLQPGGLYSLGTDQLGRDVLSRLIWGARNSLVVGVLTVLIGAAIGVSSGLLAGYLGGWLDAVIMRVYDAVLAFPGILLAILIIAVVGPGQTTVAYALAIGSTPGYARLMRSRVLQEREKDYVIAAETAGARARRIMFIHVLPNAIAPLVYVMALTMGFAVLAEASLSFLGLGTQPPTPSWGRMLTEARPSLREAPFDSIFPGLAIAILLLALNFLADALRDALDPRRTNG